MNTNSSIHPWKARFIVGTIVILLALLGLMLSNIWTKNAWNYWRIASLVFAALSLGLSFYLKRETNFFTFKLFMKEILQWVGLLGTVIIMSFYVQVGMMTKFEGSLAILTLIALNFFTMGLYIESSFTFIGIVLGLLAASAAYFTPHLYTIIVPGALISIGIFFCFVYFWKRNHPHSSNGSGSNTLN